MGTSVQQMQRLSLGKCRLHLVNPVNNHKYEVEFQVVEENLTLLLSRKAAERMKLITANYANIKQLHVVGRANCDAITDEFKTVFEGSSIGCLPGTVSLKTEDGARPVQCPPRRVPIALQSKLKEELDDLVKRNVITPVTEPTEWCSQISIQTKKNGNLRGCIYPRPLNEALRRERYPLPTLEDVLSELSHAKVFSKVDLSHGYWHCKLDEASSYLTTFITPHGRYRWLRLPFGTKVSSEIFQRKPNDNLIGLKGVVYVADDILIYGDSEEHDSNLINLLTRCSEIGLKFNKEKSMFYTSQLNFLGHVVTDKGLRPDLKKVEAILRMPNPTDVEAVRRLQGMITYPAKFLPRLSTIMEPIRRLTRQDCNWEWGEEQETAMSQLKRLVTTAPLPTYYDPEKKLTIQCDASSTGLGAALMQEGKPLAYASRALSDTEVGYAQIEKECIAIVFSLERFHQYTFGHETAVHTDHNPLETIVKKPLHKASKRIQGMLLRLLQYDIDVTYRRVKEMHFADALYRAYLSDGKDRQGQFSQINAIKHLRPINTAETTCCN